MLRFIGAALALGLGLSACQTVAPNTLSAVDTASLRFTSLEVNASAPAHINWSEAEDEYLRARGLSQTDPALVKTPEAQAYLRSRAGERLKAALQRVLANRPAGARPARLVITFKQVDIPSAVRRVLIGGSPRITADIAVYDARTNALLTSYSGATGAGYAADGVVGVAVDGAMTAGGLNDDLFDRAANDYAKDFGRWLSPT